MHNLKVEFYLKLIFIISLVSLISAYYIEYILGHQPCYLCLLERIPYGLSILVVISYFIFKKIEKFLLLLLVLIFISSFAISVYHFGIEQGFLDELSACGLKNSDVTMSKEELLKQLNQINVSCKDVTFKIFGLSLTSINILVSLFLSILLTKIFIRYEKFKN